MAYNKSLEGRIDQMWLREFPEDHRHITAKRMFGGLAYLYRGKMTLGIVGEDLMVRIPGADFQGILEESAVREMDFTGRPMKEFVFVDPEGFRSPEQLVRWAGLGLQHAKGQLAKQAPRQKK